VDCGKCAIVRFRVAASCAFFTLRFVAWVCLEVAIGRAFPARGSLNRRYRGFAESGAATCGGEK